MLQEIFNEYKQLGLRVIPIQWDEATKQPVSHRQWSNKIDFELRSTDNALMVETAGKWACIDFDLKNTQNKELFKQWMEIVTAENPDVLTKCFIEETRNKGYHVWINYHTLPKKTALADNEKGNEVIALYCSGPLVYTYPTPGYSEHFQSMEDVELLTDDEFNYLIQVSQYFNEYKPTYDPNKKAISYPKGYEKELSEYDANLSDEGWETILQSIGLEPLPNFRYNKKDKFKAFRRSESTSAAISAKVYYQTKRLLLFTASLPNFPNWHNKQDYEIWALPPSFVLFYKLNRDWSAVLAYLNIKSKDIVAEFPFEIYPDVIRVSIFEVAKERSLNPVFLATSGLWTISSLAGNVYVNESLGNDAKNILFALMVGPVSVGKTPAYVAMCEQPLRELQSNEEKIYQNDLKAWEIERAAAIAEKKQFTKKRPRRFIPVIADSTTEGYLTLSQDQQAGLGVYHDEAESIFNAGSFKGNNDSISFWTQAFNGNTFTQIRADRDKERRVENLNINLLMGTQPTRLRNVFSEDTIANGFASRFLMVYSDYLELNEKANPFVSKRKICDEWKDLLIYLYEKNKAFNNENCKETLITFTPQAKEVYLQYYQQNIKDANLRISSNLEAYILGTEAKMSTYFPRLTNIIAIIKNPVNPIIDEEIVHLSFKLYKFYSQSTLNILKSIFAEVETGLATEYQMLYNMLPEVVSVKDARLMCKKMNIPERKFETWAAKKDFKTWFTKVERGVYKKNI